MFAPGQRVALLEDLSETYTVSSVQGPPGRQILDLVDSKGEVVIDWGTYYVATGPD